MCAQCVYQGGENPLPPQNTSCQQSVTVDASQMCWIKIPGLWIKILAVNYTQSGWCIDVHHHQMLCTFCEANFDLCLRDATNEVA